MPLEKFAGFTFNHVDQEDTPDLTPEQVKAAFDSRGVDLKTFLDSLIDILNSTTDGASGADNIAATAIADLDGATVQALLKSLKDHIDTTSIDGVSNPGADIDLVGGTGITITPDNVNKKITVTATGKFAPAAHADSHITGDDVIIGTINQSVVPVGPAVASELLVLLNNLANRIKVVSGETNWSDAPGKDLKTLAGDVVAHQAEEATQNTLGHIRLSDIPQPVDYGRYQAEFGWDGAEFNQCEANNNTIELTKTIVNDIGTNFGGYLYGDIGSGQRLDANFTANISVINYIDVYLTKAGTPVGNVRCTIYDETSNQTLATKEVNVNLLAANQFNRFAFDTPVQIIPGHVIQIRFDNNASSSGNCYICGWDTVACNTQANAFLISTTNLWTSKTDSALHDLRYKINAGYLTGTATKTYAPADLRKWGNLKWTQTTPENTSVVCDVLDASNNVLKAGVTSVEDLTDINISTYPSIKTRWTLTRDTVEYESPTVSDLSVTWEGKNSYKVWEKLGSVVLTDKTFQVDLIIPPGYKVLNIKALIKSAEDGGHANLRFNDDVSLSYTTGSNTTANSLLLLTNVNKYVPDILDITIYQSHTLVSRKKVVAFCKPNDSMPSYIGGDWTNTTDEVEKISVYLGSKLIDKGSSFTLSGVR